MAEVIPFRPRNPEDADKIKEMFSKLDPNKTWEFTAIFAKLLRDNPQTTQEEKFEIWKNLAMRTSFWPKFNELLTKLKLNWLIKRIQWASFEQELITIRQFPNDQVVDES